MWRIIFVVIILGTLINLPAPTSTKPLDPFGFKGTDQEAYHMIRKAVLRDNVLKYYPKADIEVLNAALDIPHYEDFPRRSHILAVIAQESSFRRCVTDGLGSWGPMQVNLKAHPEKITEDRVCDPVENIRIGVQILRDYYLLFEGDERAALLAYNAGPRNYKYGRFVEAYYSGVKAKRKSFLRV